MAKKSNHGSFLQLPKKALIGMVHIGALPGSPFARTSLSQIESTAHRGEDPHRRRL